MLDYLWAEKRAEILVPRLRSWMVRVGWKLGWSQGRIAIGSTGLGLKRQGLQMVPVLKVEVAKLMQSFEEPEWVEKKMSGRPLGSGLD